MWLTTFDPGNGSWTVGSDTIKLYAYENSDWVQKASVSVDIVN